MMGWVRGRAARINLDMLSQLAASILIENGVGIGIAFLLTLSAPDEKSPVVSKIPVKYRVEVVAPK
jgi:hypothetical protein